MRASDDNDDWLGRRTDRSVTIPTYKQTLKSAKPVLRTVKRWTKSKIYKLVLTSLIGVFLRLLQMIWTSSQRL